MGTTTKQIRYHKRYIIETHNNSTMTPFTSNYETIKETLPKDKSLDLISSDMTSPNQGKIQSTFLQSVLSLSNKLTVALAYNANPVPSSTLFRLGDYSAILDGSKGGVVTGSSVKIGPGCGMQCTGYYRSGDDLKRNKSKNPKANE